LLQRKIIQLFGQSAPIEDITRVFIRYACRLCPSSGISPLYRLTLDQKQRRNIRTLKDWFDYSCHRNDLYRAHWQLTQQEKPQYRAVGRRYGIDPADLLYQHRLLSLEERTDLRATPEPQQYTTHQILDVVKQVERYGRFLVKQYLRYCYNNDPGIDREDFWADATCQAIKVIRNYEVTGLPVSKMVPLAARGISNHIKNLAIFYGKEGRNPLQRVETRNDTKEAWYCNVQAEQVEHVWVYVAPDRRKGKYLLAEFDNRQPAYVYCCRLYETVEEADQALLDHRRGCGGARTTVVDLTTHHTDDWMPVATSLDAPVGDDGATLIDLLQFPDYSPFESDTLDDLTQGVSDPKARLYFDALKGDLGPMFDQFCLEEYGKPYAEMTEVGLTRAAQRYCGVTRKQIQQAIN